MLDERSNVLFASGLANFHIKGERPFLPGALSRSPCARHHKFPPRCSAAPAPPPPSEYWPICCSIATRFFRSSVFCSSSISLVHLGVLKTDAFGSAGAVVLIVNGIRVDGRPANIVERDFAAVDSVSALEDGHVFDEHEVWYVTDSIPNGSSAAVALLEHRWAIPLGRHAERGRRAARRIVGASTRPRCRRVGGRGGGGRAELNRPVSVRDPSAPPTPRGWGRPPHAACGAPPAPLALRPRAPAPRRVAWPCSRHHRRWPRRGATACVAIAMAAEDLATLRQGAKGRAPA